MAGSAERRCFLKFEEDGVFNSATGQAFREATARGGSQAPMVLFVGFPWPGELSIDRPVAPPRPESGGMSDVPVNTTATLYHRRCGLPGM
jgi:hypothetical protein